MMICSSCEIRMIPSRMGVLVVVETEIGPSAVFKADEMECINCRAKVVCNFAVKPIAEYWQNKQFHAAMQVVRQTPGNVVRVREHSDRKGVGVL